MKQIIISTLLVLTACSQSGQNAGEVTFSDQTSNIVGGSAVSDQDDISKMTVQIYAIEGVPAGNGQVKISGVSECTGSIVAEDVILTAGHCTVEIPNLIFLNFNKDKPKVDDLAGLIQFLQTDANVRRVYGGLVTPEWANLLKNNTLQNWGDMALLKFKGGLPAGFHAATLVDSSATFSKGQTVTYAGWGLTDGIKQTETDTLRKTSAPVLEPNYTAMEVKADTSAQNNFCHGDSGGPVYVTANGQLRLAGVISRLDADTDKKGQCIGDSVFTKIQSEATWIAATIKTLQSPSFKPSKIPNPLGDAKKAQAKDFPRAN
jgi:hypothetical protein